MLEMLSDRASEREDVEDMIQSASGEARHGLYKRLEQLEVALGMRTPGQFSDDPVIEEWERALDDGRELPGLSDNVHPMILARREKRPAVPLRPLPTKR